MSSHCRNSGRLLFILCVIVYLCACDREKREYRTAPLPENGPHAETLSALQPGASAPPASDPRGREYENNAYHINQGERLYRWFNCNGCHAAGGGDIGPALMDDQWRYGGNIDQIYATIMDGRPFGMPSFRGKIPDTQAWEIAAYVRALSGNVPKDAAPSRREGMSATPPLSQTPKQPPKNSEQEPPH
ncbi:MAG TPA: c-type cytochrome [Rudaea sp.]|nr:c-type cytochrome [Rudaea sp.]